MYETHILKKLGFGSGTSEFHRTSYDVPERIIANNT
jgi:hypothetical protein